MTMCLRLLLLPILLALLACGPDTVREAVAAIDGGSASVESGAATRGKDASSGDSAARDAAQQLDAARGAPPSLDAAKGDAANVVHDAALAAPDASSTPLRDAGEASAPPGSCFGRCGAEVLLAIEGSCACDLDCLARGDCCVDKHELCAVSARAPICPLSGPEVDPAMCGTDLGWTFSHDGQLEIFFGDSYDGNCNVPLLYDDAQGRLPLARPAQVPERPPAAPSACGRLIELDKQGGTGRETFAPMRLFEGNNPLSSWLLETPLTGFSDGAHAYTISRRGTVLGAPLYLAVRDPSAQSSLRPERSVYRVVQQFPTTHLQNPTATAVARFDLASSEGSDYREGTGALFMWGRDDFSGPNAGKLYLAHQALPVLDADGASHWLPRYFAGLEAGKPTWSGDEADAQPVIGEDFDMVNQLEVAFIAALGKWIMLYGGDRADGLNSTPNDQPRHGAIHMRMADHPWGPWTRATPVFFREHAASFIQCDAPERPPEGKLAGCDIDDLPDDPAHSYSAGAWGPSYLDFAGCRADSPVPRSPAFVPGSIVPCNGSQRGNMYGPNLLVPWTVDHGAEQGYGRAATLYFNVSTWAPYQVILAAITLHLP